MRPALPSPGEVIPSELTERCLRWSNRRFRYRPAGEVIDAGRYGVEPIDEAPAKSFVIEHHYSGSFPAARYRVGMFERVPFQRNRLVGVAVFSVPMAQTVIPKYLDLEAARGVELGRFILTDDVPANGESWFLARAFRHLRRDLPQIAGVVSFCDPVPRFDGAGREVKRTHTGVIYRSHNARSAGSTLPRTVLLMPNGQAVSGRTLSKIRTGERGHDYARRQLLEAGAPHRCLGEDARAWLQRLQREGFFRSIRHPGNLAFTWHW